MSFKDTFGRAADITVFTPGRVNLIGEHLDYNGGMVLPTALSKGVTLSLSPRQSGPVKIAAEGFEGISERDLGEPASGHWSDYILGAVQLAVKAGFGPTSMDIYVSTDLPHGAGLSSSAAVTVATLRAAGSEGGNLSNTQLAVLARRVENEYIGVPCGIMDQMAVAIAHPGQALALDTRTLSYDLIELPKTHHIAIVHSGVYRELSEGRYAIRKEECDSVKAALRHDDLCHAEFATVKALGLKENLIRRARHCISEQSRTEKAVDALRDARLDDLGRLMNESHISMRDDFEISTPAVDALVSDAQKLGALGARLTGGGFGGCIVALVSNDRLDKWREQLLARHPNAFWVC